MPGESARRNGLKGGRPKGSKTQLDKQAARDLIREKVTAALEPMLRSQIAHAIGIGHLYTRDKTGKFTKIENQARVDHLLATGTEEEDYWIFTKDPSTMAFTDLVNQALGKPKETLELRTPAQLSDEEIDAGLARLEALRKGSR